MRRQVVVLLAVAFLSSVAFAADPPGRVARLDYMTGQVSIQPGGVNEWVAANINRPLTTSDRVWTDRDSRAELQMGAASVRLNSDTSLTLANVSDNAIQLQLDQGTLNLHIVKLFDGEIYEIDTPNIAFTVEKAGDYRFDVDNAGDTTIVTVWNGRGEATGDNPGIRISKGQQFTFRDGRSMQYATTNAPGYDGFDSWCMARADRLDKSPSLRYVSPYAVGYNDLDDYGRWETVAPYGPVWVPAGVGLGWAPYRWGHWVYIAPWGWTWVDDAPWGFTPYHYGRWVNFGPYWGWCPGPYHPRPIWAPALVGWIGGPHWGVSLSFGVGGGVGWFPLGWGEPYIPYYHHSRGYYNNVNVTNTYIRNVTVINNYYGGRNVDRIHYANMHTPQAITAVSNRTFVEARPTRNAMVPVTSQSLTRATVINTLPVRPTRESTMGPGRPLAAPPMMATRPVVTRMNPPVRPVASVGTAEVARPGRGPAPLTQYSGNPGMNDSFNRPSRAIPHPPQASAPATMAEESPRGIPRPSDHVSSAPTPSSMPSRVPRPNSGYTPNTAPPATGPAYQPSQVPHPPSAIRTAPSTSVPPTSARPSRGPTTEVPHPTYTPAPAPSMNRESRPTTHPAPPPTTNAAPPAHTSQPATAPHQSEPSRTSRPERKSDGNNSPHSEVNYPRPYGNTVRPAGFSSNPVSRSSSSVAPASHSYQPSYNRYNSYNSTQSYSSPTRSAPMMHSAPSARSSYETGSRASRPPSHSVNVSSRSAPHSSNGNPHSRH